MMNLCTLFDSNYISKGIALYLSIEQYSKDFVLYVMAMDRKCQVLLSALGFEHMIVDCIDDITDSELAKAKGNRSRAEFCWTCGSFSTDYFLHKYNLSDITYLDSDLMFFNSPRVVYEEIEKKNASVGLVPHFTSNPLFGRYCVQYTYFKNDDNGSGCLRWWKEECLRWCYSKLEDGKYGDQKYLDYFEDQFEHVYSIENRGVGIAYWNMDQYKYTKNTVKYKEKEWPIVFFHYSGLNVTVKDGVLIIKHTMYLTDTIRYTFIEPYANLLKEVFCKYLETPVNSVVISPLDSFNYFIKTNLYFLNKFLPIDWMVAQIMKIKYKERKSPYSEKK